jgi:histidinol-phosphate aminotransferase
MSPTLDLRPDLAGAAPYVSPQRPARYRMNTNESPYPPPPEVLEAVRAELGRLELNRYPDKDASALLDALSAYTGHERAGLWVANGSNEVFLHLLLAFSGPGRRVLVFEPTYSMHAMIARICGAEVIALPRAEGFTVDLTAAAEVIAQRAPEVVILCSPNNPTGNREPRATIEVLLEGAPGLVVVDEAYGEFSPEAPSAVSLLPAHPNLVVVKTLSKAWRLAGARIGYALGDPGQIGLLEVVRLPYHLSALTQALGAAALAHCGDVERRAADIAAERDRISVGLQELGVRAFPSEANFVLFEVDDPAAVWEALLVRGVLVRSYAGVPGVERCLRVTAGLPEETDAFLAAMEEVLDA